MNTRRTASITSQAGNGESPRARPARVSRWRAVVLCDVIIAVSAGLAAPARCDAQHQILVEPDDDDDPIVVRGAAAVERIVFSEQQFDQMVFGRAQPGVVVLDGGQRRVVHGQESAKDVRRQMESILDSEIRAVDTRCSLSEAQKKKLHLAGRGDIARWMSRVSELRKKYTAMTMDQQQYQAIMIELQPLRNVPQFGPFGETSLLRKTLRNTLTDEQLPRFQALVRERSVHAVENALRGWDGAASRAKLVGENRQKFIDTLVEQANLPQTNGPYMQYIVWFEAGRLEDQLKPLLDETQWQLFQGQVNNAKRVEQTLRNSGLWPAARPTDEDETPSDSTKQ